MTVHDVLGTLHTTAGDIEMGAPADVVLKAHRLTFTWQHLAASDVHGEMTAFTIRFGERAIKRELNPHQLPIPGGDITITQDVDFLGDYR